jgi:GT2 family glycosyltransferase
MSGPASALLQRTLPAPDAETEPTLYERTGAGETTHDTAFGAFHLGRWRRLTDVDRLAVTVSAPGARRAEVVAVAARRGPLGRRERVVAGVDLVGGTARLDLGGVRDPALRGAGVLWLRLLGDGTPRLREARWTTDSAGREVRLALSITTFKREDYVLPTIRRVLALVAAEPALRDSTRLVVVDNARSLCVDAPADAPIEVVPNPNLGGAGGFARGLMHARERGWATHVVFMDDDISLEPEALVRTMALLRHARDPRLCVHGAMLSEERRWMQFEAGSRYRWRSLYPLRAIGREDDLRDRRLAVRDARERRFAYTAWWFTAFPVWLTRDYPLPVFVRGDDVGYGLMHTGRHTVTLNGVVVWHADFGLKNNPSSLLYEKRNFAIIDTLVFGRHRWWHLARRFVALSFRNLFSFRYASTEYMIRGMRAYLAGPAHLAALDHGAFHDAIRVVAEERPAPLGPELAAVGRSRPRPRALRLLGFLAAVPLLGGYLLPRALRSRRLRTAPIDSRAVGLAVRHDRILYRHDRLDEGFVCERDRRRFFLLLGEVGRVVLDLARHQRRLRRDWRAAYPGLVSADAWRRRFATA